MKGTNMNYLLTIEFRKKELICRTSSVIKPCDVKSTPDEWRNLFSIPTSELFKDVDVAMTEIIYDLQEILQKSLKDDRFDDGRIEDLKCIGLECACCDTFVDCDCIITIKNIDTIQFPDWVRDRFWLGKDLQDGQNLTFRFGGAIYPNELIALVKESPFDDYSEISRINARYGTDPSNYIWMWIPASEVILSKLR